MFFSPAMCVTLHVTLCFVAQGAANFKKEPNGSDVLHNLSKPASVGELSDALGSAKDQCCDAQLWYATMASASCANVSKQAK